MTMMDADLAKLRAEYARDIPSMVANIQRATEAVIQSLARSNQADWQNLELLVHKFAGSSGTYGFHALSALARFLEERIDDGELKSLKPSGAASFLNRWYSTLAKQALKTAQTDSDPTPVPELLKPLELLLRGFRLEAAA